MIKPLRYAAVVLAAALALSGCERPQEPSQATGRIVATAPSGPAAPRHSTPRRAGEQSRPEHTTTISAASATPTTGVADQAGATTETATAAMATTEAEASPGPTQADAPTPPPPRPVVTSVEPRFFAPPPPGVVLPVKLTLRGSNLGAVRVYLREGEEEALLKVDGLQADGQVEVLAGPFTDSSRGPYDIVVRDDQGAEVIVPQALQANP
jgi:hypothetical protein